jgi:hypothetical protein
MKMILALFLSVPMPKPALSTTIALNPSYPAIYRFLLPIFREEFRLGASEIFTYCCF